MKNTDQKHIEEIFSRYPNKRAATLPLLTLAQEKFGYISKEACVWVAELIGISPMEVHETASFYTMYYLEPVGKNKIKLCTNVSCMLLGAKKIEKNLKRKLGLKKKGTTEDKKFHFETVECLGYCDKAPVMQINTETFEKISDEKVDEILGRYK